MPVVDLTRHYMNDRETPRQFLDMRRDVRRAALRGARRGSGQDGRTTVIGSRGKKIVVLGEFEQRG